MTDNSKTADPYCNRSEAFEAFDDIPTNPNLSKTFGDIVNLRYGRRDVLRGALGVTAVTALFGTSALVAADQAQAAAEGSYTFSEIEAGVDETHHVADGYDADILIRWGDKIIADAPDFDPNNQSAAAQLTQFGYNNDYIGFVPLDDTGDRALLCINHEYTNEEVMFPGLGRQDKIGFTGMTKELVEIEMAAHGGTVIEIARGADGKWSPVLESRFNRRLTASTTEMTLSGPAAGHDRLKTSTDATGTKVVGTINNCAGGITPWGTYLMAEENFHGYFWTDNKDADGKAILEGPEAASMKRYGVPGGWYAWGKYDDRFNIDKEPNESNRFGYIVEVDPMDPDATPVKHTALGRFRHEGAESIVNSDGRVVVYSGDDNRFDYLYKFVTAGTYNPDDRAANMQLLSEGTLYVARFNEDGTVDWLPLVHGEGPLTAENGFNSQADVVIDARIAADRLGATPMDRPEDVEPAPDGKVYVMLTNNTRRKPGDENPANPRADNAFGHIVEISETDNDFTSTRSTWEILVKCGDPKVTEVGAKWHPDQSEAGWFGSPDNCAIDADGRLWISTDQGSSWAKTGKADGLYALERSGDLRGKSKLFFRVPVGAELCGPKFTPDQQALFLAIQHPATDGTKNYPGFERDSTFEDPATRWPDFADGMPPRPSVVVVTKQGGGKIAG
ncbi:MAG: PhoX family phosphatase [Pseudomonadota bacterium]